MTTRAERRRTPEPEKRPAFEPPSRLLKPLGYDPDMPRPASTVAGTVLVLLRVAVGVLVLVAIGLNWDAALADPDLGIEADGDTSDAARWLVIVSSSIVLLVDLVLAILIFRGRNWARVLVMLIAVLSISTVFVAWWAAGQEVTIQTTYLSVALDILLLLALSSRSAAAYARRKERPWIEGP